MKIPFPKKLLLLALLLFAVNSAYAQGPVQPEAMQFEPVDATDVVNLTTGDFVYTIPLMSIPGPAGDYPIAMSYHSGIGLNQPATWVGLGWTLNPGAINRVINGAPDDYVGGLITTHYEAQDRGHGFIVGIGFGPVGIDMTFDQNMSLVGYNMSVGEMVGIGPIGIGGRVGWGTDGASANATVGIVRKMGDNIGVAGISAGTSGISGTAGIYNDLSEVENGNALFSMGANISSKGSGASFGISGVGVNASTSMNGQGKTNVRSFATPRIPILGPISARVGFYDWKWTLNETNNDYTNGYLYQNDDGSSKYERHKSKLTDGTEKGYLYPSQDNYNISGQGVGGAFMPFDDYGITLTDLSGNNENGYVDDNTTNREDMTFRLLGEQGYNHTTINQNFTWGNQFDRINTNRNYTTKIVPFHNTNPQTGRINEEIDGFIVTTPDGMIYEYMAPIRTKRQYSELTSDENGITLKSTLNLKEEFAQVWLLTAIKGPDYVDRASSGGADGVLNEFDWGYWVKFNYDYLAKDGIWRAPFSGTSPGEQDSEQFTAGKREIAYLSSIETKTHIAVFTSSFFKNGRAPGLSNEVKTELDVTISSAHSDGTKKLDTLALYQRGNLSDQIQRVSFSYDYSLRKNTPGSVALSSDGAVGGTLTLKDIKFEGQNGVLSTPPYRFEYANNDLPAEGLNPEYHVLDWDYWGNYRTPDEGRGLIEHRTSQNKEYADLAAAWSLTKINTPTGGSVEIEYESDDYYSVNDLYDITNRVDLPVVEGSLGQVFGNQLTIENGTSIGNLFAGQKIYLTLETKYTGSYNVNGNVVFFQAGVKQIYDDINEIISIDLINNTVTLQNNITLSTLSSTFGDCDTEYCDWWDYYISVIPPVNYGGGIRVKSIRTTDGSNSYATNYEYKEGEFSTGITPSLNTPFDEDILGLEAPSNYEKINGYLPLYLNHPLSYGRPAPSVMYSKVTMYNASETGEYLSGKSEFEFYSPKDFPYKATKTTNQIIVDDYSGIYGKQKAVTLYEQVDNSGVLGFRKVRNMNYEYAFSDDLGNTAKVYEKDWQAVSNQSSKPLGITQQKHKSEVQFASGNNWINTNIEHTRYNIYPVSQTNREYFYSSDQALTHSSLLEVKSRTIGFDMYTGLPLVNVTESKEDNELFINRNTPAWWEYPGLESKNMLTQNFEKATFKAPYGIDQDTNQDNILDILGYDLNANYSHIIASSVTTWDQWGANNIWRKNDTYEYFPEYDYVPYPIADLDYSSASYVFPNQAKPWEMTSNITQYDNFGHTIEASNKDGTFNAVIYDEDNNSLVKAVASNAKLDEVIYSNFETYSGSIAHTGEKSRYFNGSTTAATAPSGTPSHGGKYKAYFWLVSTGATQVNNQTIPAGNAGEWRLVKETLNPGQVLYLNGSGYIDDVTIVPEYASISYFSYDPLTWKVTSMTGPNHRTTFYEYDDAGRLTLTRDFENNIISKNEYGYSGEFYIEATPENPVKDQLVSFTLKNSNDHSNATQSSYSWSFGDGIIHETTSSNATTHTYSERKDFSLSLTIEDDDGNTRRIFKDISVIDGNGNGPINISINYGLSCAVTTCDVIPFSTVTNGYGALTYVWSRRNSVIDEWEEEWNYTLQTYENNPVLKFEDEPFGSFQLKLRVTDSTGTIAEEIITVIVGE